MTPKTEPITEKEFEQVKRTTQNGEFYYIQEVLRDFDVPDELLKKFSKDGVVEKQRKHLSDSGFVETSIRTMVNKDNVSPEMITEEDFEELFEFFKKEKITLSRFLGNCARATGPS